MKQLSRAFRPGKSRFVRCPMKTLFVVFLLVIYLLFFGWK